MALAGTKSDQGRLAFPAPLPLPQTRTANFGDPNAAFRLTVQYRVFILRAAKKRASLVLSLVRAPGVTARRTPLVCGDAHSQVVSYLGATDITPCFVS